MPAGHDAVRLPRLPHRVPQLRALAHRHVQLPAEVADVRDPRREHVEAVDRDVLPGAEREALVRDVVARDRREDVARARAPEPDRAPRRREVLDPRVADEVVGEPFLVRHAVRAARDDAEPVVVHLHDRQVGLEAAARRQHRRVDHAPGRHVHLPCGDLLHRLERIRRRRRRRSRTPSGRTSPRGRASRDAPR